MKSQFHRVIVAAFVVVLPQVTTAQLPALDPDAFADLTPEELFQKSFDSDRGCYRSYLATYHPDTPQGRFARAWDGSGEESFRINRELVAAPEMHGECADAALYNLIYDTVAAGGDGTWEKVKPYYDLAMRRNPFLLSGRTPVHDGAEDDWKDFKKEYASTFESHPLLLNYLEAKANVFVRRDYAAVREILPQLYDNWDTVPRRDLQSIASNVLAWELYSHVFPQRTSDEKGDAVNSWAKHCEAIAEGMPERDKQRFITFAKHKALKSHLELTPPKRRSPSLQGALHILYSGLQELDPRGEVAWEYARLFEGSYNPLSSSRQLETLNQHEQPYSPLYHRARGLVLFRLNEHAKAVAAYNKSLSIQFHEKSRLETAVEFAWSYHVFLKGDYATAKKLIEPFAKSGDDDVKETACRALATLSGCSAETGDARSSLNRLATIDSHNRIYHYKVKNAVSRAEAIFKERDQHFEKYPHHKAWLAQFGIAGLHLYFDKDSSDVDDIALRQLKRIQAVIPEEHMNSTVLTVLGCRGEDETEAVASARAKEVSRGLQVALGFSEANIDYRVSPLSNIVAESASELEVRQTQRVEIHFGGDTRFPSLATPTNIPQTLDDVSPDGRLAILGGEVWDVEKRVRLFQLAEASEAKFSPNGQWIASFLSATPIFLVVIHDAQTGAPVRVFPSPANSINELEWSPDGNRIAVVNGIGFEPNGVSVIDAATGQLNVAAYTDNSTGVNVAWLMQGKHLVVQPWAAYRLPILDSRTGVIWNELKGPKWAHSCASTHRGDTLLIADDTRKLHVYEFDERDNFDHHEMDTKVGTKQIQIHPTRPIAILNDMWGTRPHLTVVNYDDKEVVNRWTFGGEQRTNRKQAHAHWLGNSDSMLVENPEFGYRTASSDLSEWQDFDSLGTYATRSVGFSQLNLLVTIDRDGIHVWDILSGRKLQQWPGANLTYLGARSDKKSFLIAEENKHDKSTTISLHSLDDFSITRVTTLDDFDIQCFGIRDSKIVLAGTKFATDRDRVETGQLIVLDHEAGDVDARHEIDMVSEPVAGDRYFRSQFQRMAVNNAGTEAIISTEWIAQIGWGMTPGKMIRFVDLETGKTADSRIYGKKPRVFYYDENDTYRVSFSEYYPDVMYERSTHKNLGEATETQLLLQSHDYDEQLFQAFADRNLRVEVMDTNEILFYRRDTGELELTIISQKDGEWLAVAPSGEFTASLDGGRDVYWRVGSKLLPLRALRSKFERPDLVTSRLRSISEGDKSKAVSTIDGSLFSLPYGVELLCDADSETTDEEFEFRIRVEIQDESAPDPVVEFLQNGRVLPDARGKLKLVKTESSRSVEFRRTFRLDEGLNLLGAQLVFNEARVLPLTARVNRSAGGGSSALALAPALYFFGVGVSDYEAEEQNLSYAHVDAESLANTFRKQEGRLYSKVNSLVLTNEKATARNIQLEMLDFLEQASSQDVVVIFLAGHGARDSRENLYFIPHDGQLDRPRTGMDMEFFSKALTQRPENQKALFLLDICHAGAVSQQFKARGRVVSEELVKQLSQGTGTIVLASSTGAQSSFEDESFGGGHGAFTHAIIEGLQGKADIVADDDAISVNELTTFVCRRVPELTERNQHPTTPNAHNVRDFPIATK